MIWLDAIAELAQDHVPAVLVTVARVEGSAPRETGAKLVVTASAQFDTIGGGHLELCACEVARTMLAQAADAPQARRRLLRFPLGPSLGQCCGGVVHLAFERIEDDASFAQLRKAWRERHDCWRLVPLDAPDGAVIADAAGKKLSGRDHAPLPQFDRAAPCHVMQDAAGARWLVDPVLAYRPHLVLFGAGHVGAAIARALGELPCHVVWVDERDDLFPQAVPSNVRIEVTDTPEAVVDAAPAGASFLVMTHSHALDQNLAEAILRRADMGWFGLIGSKTKRMQFEHRLRERGIAQERLADMVCPIGIPGIGGKQPAVIAIAVCAQLLSVWENAGLTVSATR